MYQVEFFNIEVTNSFEDDVDFSIKLSDIVPKYESNKSIKEEETSKKQRKKKKENFDVVNPHLTKEDPSVPNAFFIKHQNLKLKKGQTKTLVVQFIPFENRIFRN